MLYKATCRDYTLLTLLSDKEFSRSFEKGALKAKKMEK